MTENTITLLQSGKVAIMKPDHPCGDAWEVALSHA
jgi:hypothetical protein